jgi:hypothetical protein
VYCQDRPLPVQQKAQIVDITHNVIHGSLTKSSLEHVVQSRKHTTALVLADGELHLQSGFELLEQTFGD